MKAFIVNILTVVCAVFCLGALVHFVTPIIRVEHTLCCVDTSECFTVYPCCHTPDPWFGYLRLGTLTATTATKPGDAGRL
jgi:hypothetical protein